MIRPRGLDEGPGKDYSADGKIIPGPLGLGPVIDVRGHLDRAQGIFFLAIFHDQSLAKTFWISRFIMLIDLVTLISLGQTRVHSK